MLTDDQFFNLLLWFFVLRSRSIPHQHDSQARKFRTSAAHRMISRHYDDFFLLFIGKAELPVDKSVHSRYQKAFHKMLSPEEKRKRDRRIPRLALQLPSESAWRKLFNANNDQSLITLTGLDHATFQWLLSRFSAIYDAYTPHSMDGEITKLSRNKNDGGRPRLMSACNCMGLYLSWTRLRGTTVPLQMIFGMSATSVAIYLKFSRRILIHILSRSRDAAIKIPSSAKIMEYQRTISAKHPKLKEVWCTMDGLKIYLEQSGDPVTQNRFYNGWTCDHYVSAVLVFCPDGTIVPSQSRHTRMCLGRFTTARLQNGETFMRSCKAYMTIQVESVQWIPRLVKNAITF